MAFPNLRATALSALVLTFAACTDESPTAIQAPTSGALAYTAPSEPVNGEFIRQSGQSTVWMVFDRTLWGVPDQQTLRACTGGRQQVVRSVSSLPAWTQRTLPSAGNPQTRPHGNAWMFGDRPVQSNAGGAVYLVVGCVRAGFATQAAYQGTFGDTDWSRVVTVADATLKSLPEGPLAQGTPLRRAGTLIESAGVIRWVTYHRGALGVPDPATMDAYCRPWSDMVDEATDYSSYTENWTIQATTSACLRGNDYPYAGSSMSGADPWNFYNRQCTSFSAWRLNQDGTEFHNYFRGPHWGDAHNWNNAAAAAGITVNGIAKQGAIAQWESGAYGAASAGHVAYVAAVHNDGYITIEEYNWATVGGYGTRRIPASNVSNYIHFR
jgi:surface antigen